MSEASTSAVCGESGCGVLGISESKLVAEKRKIADAKFSVDSTQNKKVSERRNMRKAVQRTSEVVCGLKKDRHAADELSAKAPTGESEA